MEQRGAPSRGAVRGGETDEAVARRLWDVSEELHGGAVRVGGSGPGAAGAVNGGIEGGFGVGGDHVHVYHRIGGFRAHRAVVSHVPAICCDCAVIG